MDLVAANYLNASVVGQDFTKNLNPTDHRIKHHSNRGKTLDY
jgi:hypothetical protein